MLCTSRIDPSKSAYKTLEGPHDFSRHPWAPPGCRAVIHELANNKTSWGLQGTNTWYIGPAPNHYWSYKFYVPETQAYRIPASAQFFPSYCEIPTETPFKDAACTAAELIIELHQHCNADTHRDLSQQQYAIKIINEIYKHSNKQPPRVDKTTAQPPRGEPTLSGNPTAPRTMKKGPRTHNRITRNNTLGLAFHNLHDVPLAYTWHRLPHQPKHPQAFTIATSYPNVGNHCAGHCSPNFPANTTMCPNNGTRAIHPF
ncbi:hypothetical protein ACHAW6_000282 [Cyclotella cf. meneghiniana]